MTPTATPSVARPSAAWRTSGITARDLDQCERRAAGGPAEYVAPGEGRLAGTAFGQGDSQDGGSRLNGSQPVSKLDLEHVRP